MLLASAASFWLGNLWLEKRDDSSRHLIHLESLVTSAEATLEKRGSKDLQPWLQNVRRHSPLRVNLVQFTTLEALQSQMLLPHLHEHMQQALNHHGLVETTFEGMKILSLPIITAEAQQYRLVTEMHDKFSNKPDHEMSLLKELSGKRVFIAFVITALLCFVIAYVLVRPIRQMQEAVRSLGHGDLSARMKMDARRDEIGDLAREFNAMASKIDGMMQSQQRLLRDVSHELRSPLARLQVALELARKRTGTQAELELNRIALEAKEVDSMIGDMLTLVRLENSERDAESINLQEPIELNILISSIVCDANYEFEEQEKQICFSAGLPVTFFGNHALLCSAIENVVRNAMKYTADASTVEINLKTFEKKQVEITIRDNGQGVPEEDLAKLYNPFFRVGEARDRQSGGFGLGLSIAARVIL